MEKNAADFSIYVGKIGVDNFLLMAVGVLFLTLYILKRQEAAYERLYIYLYSGFFFLCYGFLYDAYRFKPLRKFLLYHFSFQPYRTIILLITLLPLYSCLIESILRIISRRLKR